MKRKPTRGQIEAVEHERVARRRRVDYHREKIDRLKPDLVLARERGDDPAANRVFDQMVDEQRAMAAAEREVLQLERDVATGWLPPDPNGLDALRHAEALKRLNLREAIREGLDPTYWRRSLAVTRRRRLRVQVAGAARGLRPSRRRCSRPRSRSGRTSRPTRAGPADDGDPEPAGLVPRAQPATHNGGRP